MDENILNIIRESPELYALIALFYVLRRLGKVSGSGKRGEKP